MSAVSSIKRQIHSLDIDFPDVTSTQFPADDTRSSAGASGRGDNLGPGDDYAFPTLQ
jgi:hypothetical protein